MSFEYELIIFPPTDVLIKATNLVEDGFFDTDHGAQTARLLNKAEGFYT